MSSTQVAKSIHERFYEFRDDWKSKTRHLSDTAQISLVFSYQKIIGITHMTTEAIEGGDYGEVVESLRRP